MGYCSGVSRTRTRVHGCQNAGAFALAVLCMVFAVGFIAACASQLRVNRISRAFDACATEEVGVVAGESLWDIAVRHGVDGVSTYEVIRWIKEHNDLCTSELPCGRTIKVPTARKEPL